MSRYKVLCTVGTRPEAIKMAPVILALQQAPWAEVQVLATGQHRELLDQVLGLFRIEPQEDLHIMEADQSLPALSARLLQRLDQSLPALAPDLVLAQGDTTTVFMTALASFYHRIPFGHVEAGLRTGDLAYPFPEEANRVLAARLASLHLAPTLSARDNLLREGISPGRIYVTGNTVIDALFEVARQAVAIGVELHPEARLILLTAHRRENFGAPLQEVCQAVLDIVERNPTVEVLYPVHPNPNVRRVVQAFLSSHPRVLLAEPLDYGAFVSALQRAFLILTDSGGVQEEAPALGKPVLVLRHETERPEAVTAGVVRLVGTSRAKIAAEVQRLLDDPVHYRSMARGASPYGDGRAAARIVAVVGRFLGIEGVERIPMFDG